MSASIFNDKNHVRFEDIVYKDLSPEDQKIYDKIYGIMGDRDGNGQSDFMDDEFFQCIMQGDANGVVFRGTTYKSFAEMPEDIRPKLKYAFNQLTNMGMIHPHVHGLLSK